MESAIFFVKSVESQPGISFNAAPVWFQSHLIKTVLISSSWGLLSSQMGAWYFLGKATSQREGMHGIQLWTVGEVQGGEEATYRINVFQIEPTESWSTYPDVADVWWLTAVARVRRVIDADILPVKCKAVHHQN